MNWFTKQLFLIRFLCGKKVIKDSGLHTFYSDSFSSKLWWQDDANWNHSYFTQQYGCFRFVAKLNGSFDSNSWPALWLVNWNNQYREIDIELIQDSKNPHLVFTSFWNPKNDSSKKEDGCIVERFRYDNQSLIRKLQTEYNEFIIEWLPDKIRFYINGLLCCELKNSPKGDMWIVSGKADIREITTYLNS